MARIRDWTPNLTGDVAEGTVTVLFTDVQDSTELRVKRGDETAHQILRTQDELIRQQVSAHGGREVKGMGDGIMAAFGSARRAVVCAAGIQRALEEHNRQNRDAEVAVRIGLNSGEVNREAGDLFGAAVNAAARVAAKAKGGEILVSSVVRQLAGKVPEVSFVDRGRFRLKGFDERWQLFEAVWRPDTESAAAPTVARTAFVGRDAERDQILRLLAAAAEGHGAVVMIGGEPGIGKTRLTEEITAEAQKRGFRASTGHCVEMEGGLAYMPFVEILEAAIKDWNPENIRAALGEAAPEVARVVPHLRRLFPDIPPPLELPPEQERRYLFNSIQEFIARGASIRPQVVVLDDLHWGDEATLLLLQHLAEHIQEMAVLLLVTYREVELDASRPLARVLEDFLRRRLAHRVSLKRLPREAVAEMLKVLARGQDPPAQLIDVIHRETEGNPFFVEEVFQHLSEAGQLFDAEGRWKGGLEISEADVPAGVRLVIGRRLERLSEEARLALSTAAVIGRSFGYRLLESACDLDPDALLDAVDAAERAQLIVATSEGAEANFVFAHELIRQTLLANLSLPRRQRWHLRVADAMEHVLGEQAAEHASQLSHHLFMAGEAADPARTASYLRLAGDRATESAAYEEALRSYETALSLQPEEDRRARADLLSRVGLAHQTLGHWDLAMQIFGRAVDAFEALGDGAAAGSACYRMAYLLLWRGRFQEALEVGGRGLTALGDERSGERARLLAFCGNVISVAGGHDQGKGMITEAIEVATELGDRAALAQIKGVLAIHHWYYAQNREAVEVGLEAVEMLRAERMPWEMANVIGFVALSQEWIGQIAEALELHQELAPLARKMGHHGAQIVDLRTMFLAHLAAGDLDAADAEAQQDLEVCLAGGLPWYRDSYQMQAAVAFARGDWDRAVVLCRQAGEYDFPYVGAPAEPGALMMYLAYAGQRDEALRLLDRLRDYMPVPGVPNGWGSWFVPNFAVEGLVAMGELQVAAELYPLVEEAINELGGVMRGFDGRSARVIAAIAAAAGGMWDRAEEHFRLGRVDAERLGPMSVADLNYFEAWALFLRGPDADRERAVMLRDEAISSYRSIGMPRHVDLAENLG